jgi:hypothetical protein
MRILPDYLLNKEQNSTRDTFLKGHRKHKRAGQLGLFKRWRILTPTREQLYERVVSLWPMMFVEHQRITIDSNTQQQYTGRRYTLL